MKVHGADVQRTLPLGMPASCFDSGCWETWLLWPQARFLLIHTTGALQVIAQLLVPLLPVRDTLMGNQDTASAWSSPGFWGAWGINLWNSLFLCLCLSKKIKIKCVHNQICKIYHSLNYFWYLQESFDLFFFLKWEAQAPGENKHTQFSCWSWWNFLSCFVAWWLTVLESSTC